MKERPPPALFRLPRAIFALGAASFFTDLSAEMIFPLLPVFLAATLGAGAAQLGLIEGVAETTAGILKVASGYWTDRTAKRKPLIVFGYTLSGAARPLIGLATAWPIVLALRFLDRVGKGLRTSPRDAFIADTVPPEHRGRAYGVHRAMDHAGAVVGPLVAAALLGAGVEMRTVFLLAGIPASIVILVLLIFVKEPARAELPPVQTAKERVPLATLPQNYRRLLFALFVFTLGCSTDAFLLMRLADCGVPPQWVAVLWSMHHVVKSAIAGFCGKLADHYRPGSLLVVAWLLYAAVYLAFGFVDNREALAAIFLVYGVFFGLSEPAERAWVAELAPAKVRGSAFGFYHGAVALASFPASAIVGLLWTKLGAPFAFGVGAFFAVIGCFLLRRVR